MDTRRDGNPEQIFTVAKNIYFNIVGLEGNLMNRFWHNIPACGAP
jgi:hypothetical protein